MDGDSRKREIGERLRSVLDERSITQATVAGWFGIAQTSVSAWCRGASEFSITQGAELADRLGISLDWLVGLSERRGEAPTAKDRAAAELLGLIEARGVEAVSALVASALADRAGPGRPRDRPGAPPAPASSPPPPATAPSRPLNNLGRFLKAVDDGKAKAEARAKGPRGRKAQ